MPRSLCQQLFEQALRFATPFSDPLGHGWAIVPDGPTRHHAWPVHSRAFREWLAYSFQHEFEIFPGVNALRGAIALLSAHAHHSEFPTSEVFTRIGWRGNRLNPESILLNLGNSAGDVVEIAPSGRRIVASQSWRFLADPSAAPLPRPVDTSATLIEQLEPLLGIRGPALHRIAVWLFSALRPAGPHPVLMLTGPQASGKSTVARILRSFIDPSATPLLSPPASPRALFSIALHNRVLAFDHVNALPRNIADSIARLAMGAGIAVCGRSIIDAPESFALERPVIMTARRKPRSLTAMAIDVGLETLGLENERTSAAVAQAVELAAPSILGALCDAASQALGNLAAIEIPAVSLIPDVHQWAIAGASALGLTVEEINRAVAANPLIERLHAFLGTEPEWTGTASELRKALSFDGTSAHLSEQLAAASLPLFGLAFERWMGHNTRRIRLTHTPRLSVSKAAA